MDWCPWQIDSFFDALDPWAALSIHIALHASLLSTPLLWAPMTSPSLFILLRQLWWGRASRGDNGFRAHLVESWLVRSPHVSTTAICQLYMRRHALAGNAGWF